MSASQSQREPAQTNERKRQIRREREQKAAEKLRLEQMAAKVCS